MDLMPILMLLNALAFAGLFAIWTPDGWVNFLFKFIFLLLLIANGLAALKVFGLVIRVPM